MAQYASRYLSAPRHARSDARLDPAVALGKIGLLCRARQGQASATRLAASGIGPFPFGHAECGVTERGASGSVALPCPASAGRAVRTWRDSTGGQQGGCACSIDSSRATLVLGSRAPRPARRRHPARDRIPVRSARDPPQRRLVVPADPVPMGRHRAARLQRLGLDDLDRTAGPHRTGCARTRTQHRCGADVHRAARHRRTRGRGVARTSDASHRVVGSVRRGRDRGRPAVGIAGSHLHDRRSRVHLRDAVPRCGHRGAPSTTVVGTALRAECRARSDRCVDPAVRARSVARSRAHLSVPPRDRARLATAARGAHHQRGGARGFARAHRLVVADPRHQEPVATDPQLPPRARRAHQGRRAAPPGRTAHQPGRAPRRSDTNRAPLLDRQPFAHRPGGRRRRALDRVDVLRGTEHRVRRELPRRRRRALARSPRRQSPACAPRTPLRAARDHRVAVGNRAAPRHRPVRDVDGRRACAIETSTCRTRSSPRSASRWSGSAPRTRSPRSPGSRSTTATRCRCFRSSRCCSWSPCSALPPPRRRSSTLPTHPRRP